MIALKIYFIAWKGKEIMKETELSKFQFNKLNKCIDLTKSKTEFMIYGKGCTSYVVRLPRAK